MRGLSRGLGPGRRQARRADRRGGNSGEVMKNRESLTGKYLTARWGSAFRKKRRELRGRKKVIIKKAAENNLKNIDVEIPLGVFTCVTGVSGSGKSTLVDEILFKGLSKRLYQSKALAGKHETILGLNEIDKVIEIDQSPIGARRARTPQPTLAFSGRYATFSRSFPNRECAATGRDASAST